MASDRGLPSLPRNLDREMRVYLQALGATVQRLAGNVRGSEQARAVRAAEGGTGAVGQGAVSAWNIANKAVTTEKLVDGSVTEAKIADGAVSSVKIAANAVETKHVKPGAVTTDCVADNAITGARLAPKSVSAKHIADGAVKVGAIAEGAVTSTAIAKSAITGSALADRSVTTGKILDGAVTADKLASGVIPPAPSVPSFIAGEAADGDVVVLPGAWEAGPVAWVAGFSLSVPEGGNISVGAESVRQNEDGAWMFDAVARAVAVDDLGVETVTPGALRWVAAGNRITDED